MICRPFAIAFLVFSCYCYCDCDCSFGRQSFVNLSLCLLVVFFSYCKIKPFFLLLLFYFHLVFCVSNSAYVVSITENELVSLLLYCRYGLSSHFCHFYPLFYFSPLASSLPQCVSFSFSPFLIETVSARRERAELTQRRQ